MGILLKLRKPSSVTAKSPCSPTISLALLHSVLVLLILVLLHRAIPPLASQSSGGAPISVIITSYSVEGYRPKWLRFSLEYYTSEALSSLINKVVLVWNNEDHEPPDIPGVHVLRRRNSLNQRWNSTAAVINTEAVLNLDDDVLLLKDGLECLYKGWSANKDQLTGPVVRRHDGRGYLYKEIGLTNRPYSIMLPRIMLLHRMHLEIYETIVDEAIKAYVDAQAGHCDDLVLNLAATKLSGRAPARVIPPRGSVVDFFETCYRTEPGATGGLTLDEDRAALRSECLDNILAMFGDKNSTPRFLEYSTSVDICMDSTTICRSGENCGITPPEAFRAMVRNVSCDSLLNGI